MNKEEAFKEINEKQDFYIKELVKILNDEKRKSIKEVNFRSDTGTGKTKMMAKLCNMLPEVYFVITTLSRGQLKNQIRENLKKDIKQNNFVVYGLQDFTTNTILQKEDILEKIPKDKKIYWLRDEGHINTNRWYDILSDISSKIINFSATLGTTPDIDCNFIETMMLRTVEQNEGTPEDALNKLLEVKKIHSKIKNYNPCAIFRCLDDSLLERIIEECEKRNLKFINITEEDFDMSELCMDDNEFDVIINKFKIVEGIDIRRAHVLYLSNEPGNPATTIQIIGRCRRNALLYRNDIDIFSIKNRKLLEKTRECFVFYNVKNMKIDTDENGNLITRFCNEISCEKLKTGSIIEVENGKLFNGLKVIELEGETGKFEILKDEKLGFNYVIPKKNNFYNENIEEKKNFIYISFRGMEGIRAFDIGKIKKKLTLKILI